MAWYLQKRASRGSDGLSEHCVCAEDFPPALVAVGEFLTRVEWADGARRAPGSITLFFEDGALKACLNDKDGKVVTFVSGSSWVELWGNAEKGLREDTLGWRRQREWKGKRGS